MENIVAKREIACFEQFLLWSLCFQKVVCCRGVRKRLYVGKGKGPFNILLAYDGHRIEKHYQHAMKKITHNSDKIYDTSYGPCRIYSPCDC